ncbi:hypothetical protein J8273_3234 [Carpediemonas membranifera]|uniref:Uncharacterized protein n=1 Tax=Carpediemonas membranifera TaxID=201153 RepID=A0A8J6AW75_9EUKA|nr:hypothetical protein J8273_3234 [Carpediemonas membranifera]|eukprot:KAG9393105.1 hypothetical protein J8273_3234 [Carpediemonas membranifera]
MQDNTTRFTHNHKDNFYVDISLQCSIPSIPFPPKLFKDAVIDTKSYLLPTVGTLESRIVDPLICPTNWGISAEEASIPEDQPNEDGTYFIDARDAELLVYTEAVLSKCAPKKTKWFSKLEHARHREQHEQRISVSQRKVERTKAYVPHDKDSRREAIEASFDVVMRDRDTTAHRRSAAEKRAADMLERHYPKQKDFFDGAKITVEPFLPALTPGLDTQLPENPMIWDTALVTMPADIQPTPGSFIVGLDNDECVVLNRTKEGYAAAGRTGFKSRPATDPVIFWEDTVNGLPVVRYVARAPNMDMQRLPVTGATLATRFEVVGRDLTEEEQAQIKQNADIIGERGHAVGVSQDL